MNFKWSMTEIEWRRYKDDCSSKKQAHDDFYGSVHLGNLCVEFVSESYSSDKLLPLTNWYCLYKDSGYGYTNNGTPYDLLDVTFSAPISCDTFDSFKKRCEDMIREIVEESENLLVEANQPIANWI